MLKHEREILEAIFWFKLLRFYYEISLSMRNGYRVVTKVLQWVSVLFSLEWEVKTAARECKIPFFMDEDLSCLPTHAVKLNWRIQLGSIRWLDN